MLNLANPRQTRALDWTQTIQLAMTCSYDYDVKKGTGMNIRSEPWDFGEIQPAPSKRRKQDSDTVCCQNPTKFWLILALSETVGIRQRQSELVFTNSLQLINKFDHPCWPHGDGCVSPSHSLENLHLDQSLLMRRHHN